MTEAPNPERYHKPWALDAQGNRRDVDGYRIYFEGGEPPLLSEVQEELFAKSIFFTLKGEARFEGVVEVCCGNLSVEVEFLLEHPESVAEGVRIYGDSYDFKLPTYLLDCYYGCKIGEVGDTYLMDLGSALSYSLSDALIHAGNGGKHWPRAADPWEFEWEYDDVMCVERPRPGGYGSIDAICLGVSIRIGCFYRENVGIPKRGDELPILSKLEEKKRAGNIRYFVANDLLTQCRPRRRMIEDEYVMTPENAAKWDALVSQVPKRRSA